MFREGILDKILRRVKKIMPKGMFDFFAPLYHWGLAWGGALLYGFPSRSMKIIGVTGTKGKSTTVYLIAKILEEALRPAQGGPAPVAAIGSLGYKIKDKEWPNNLKMTMPGRFKVQKFLSQAKKAGCKFVVLEVTSEGIKQKRHLGIKFDTAVLTNIYPEHIESHGSLEKYIQAKEQLFKRTKNTHILNEDEPELERFKKIKSNKKILYGWHDWAKLGLETKLRGDFNKYNILAAVAVAENYRLPLAVIKRAINKVDHISGRMEYIDAGQSFKVVVDYAHTPDSLELVYKALRPLRRAQGRQAQGQNTNKKLICVLGAAGGGRDKWKRPEFGRIAAQYCDEIILTNEDPYDENPEAIVGEIASGFSQPSTFNPDASVGAPTQSRRGHQPSIIFDRKEAIAKALTLAKEGDVVVITGKGSETSMAIAGGVKIPWSDKEVVLKIFLAKTF